ALVVVIVIAAIANLGVESVLVAVVIGGALQILLGILIAGVIGDYFSSSVIKGMLAGIGIIIFLKQIPLVLGIDSTAFSANGVTQFVNSIHPSVVIISALSLGILLLWDNIL